jgi:hypothetical protein
MDLKVIKYSIWLVLLVLASSCRKELPQLPIADEPVFFLKTNSPDLSLNIEAGKQNVVFNDSVSPLLGVATYKAFFTKADTTIEIRFYGGEVFKDLSMDDVMNMTSIDLASLAFPVFDSIAFDSLTLSNFDQISFSQTQFNTPGKYEISCSVGLNANEVQLSNSMVVGYDNPYVFELRGVVIGTGPTAILDAQILNNSTGIQRVDWVCGTHTSSTAALNVQFPPIGASNELSATVTFTDGTTRTRSIAMGFQNGPKLQDFVYTLEQYSLVSFTKRLVFDFNFNGAHYSSMYATNFTAGNPYINITNRAVYIDPVSQRKSFLFTANGLIYVRNSSTFQTIPINIDMQIGLPIDL